MDGQTITKTADDKAFVVTKNSVLQYIIDNQELLFAQDKSWDKGLLKKKGALLPIEILDKDKKVVTKLKVGKMAETRVLSGSGSSATLDIDKDSDRFYIRIPGAASMGAVSIKVATVENPDVSSYNDDETEIDMQVEGSDLITKSMLLVSDDVDDNHQVGGVTDDSKNDRTHKIQLGGKFQVKSIKIGGAEHQADIKTTTFLQKTVDINIVIFRNKPLSAGGVPLISAGDVQRDWKIANERYSQVGIKVNIQSLEIKDPPTGVDLTDGSLTVSASATGRPLADEAKNAIAALGTKGNSSDIHVFYVNQVQIGSTFLGGIALADYYYGSTDPDFTYNIFIKTIALTPWSGYAAAHELGHLLTNAGHEDAYGVDYSIWHLMYGNTLNTNGITGSRRLNSINQTSIQGNSHAK